MLSVFKIDSNPYSKIFWVSLIGLVGFPDQPWIIPILLIVWGLLSLSHLIILTNGFISQQKQKLPHRLLLLLRRSARRDVITY